MCGKLATQRNKMELKANLIYSDHKGFHTYAISIEICGLSTSFLSILIFGILMRQNLNIENFYSFVKVKIRFQIERIIVPMRHSRWLETSVGLNAPNVKWIDTCWLSYSKQYLALFGRHLGLQAIYNKVRVFLFDVFLFFAILIVDYWFFKANSHPNLWMELFFPK